MPTIRSFLFVPASRMDRVEKALATSADAIIIDLEDAVALNAKDQARTDLGQWLSQQNSLHRVWVRINPLNTDLGQADFDVLGHIGVAGWVLPKAEDVAAVEKVAQGKHSQSQLALLIETAIGIDKARELAKCSGVTRLMFGTIDFQLDMNMKCDALESQLDGFRLQLTLASRLAGLHPPVDGVTVTTDDSDLLAKTVAKSRSFGFGAKLCIHPKQVNTVNTGFMPSAEEFDWAQRVIEGERTHQGAAFSIDGKMIDRPVIELAQRVIQQHQREA